MPNDRLEEDAWFQEHIYPHAEMVRAWLRSRFQNERDVDDILHDAFLRVLRAHRQGPIASPKAYLFATARNIAVSQIRTNVRQKQFAMADLDELGVFAEGADVATAVSHAEELELLTEAVQSLPARCRQIITLRKIYGISQKEIAKHLGISVNTVETQGTIGIRKIAAFFERLNRRRR